MKGSVFKQKVNFFVSVLFIASFGVFMAAMVLKVAHAENPIESALAAEMSDAAGLK